MIGTALVMVIAAIVTCSDVTSMLLLGVTTFLGVSIYYVGIAFLGAFVKALLGILANDVKIRQRAVAWGVVLFGISGLIQLLTPGSVLGMIGGLVELASVVMAAPELMQIAPGERRTKLLQASVYMFAAAALIQLVAPQAAPERIALLLKALAGVIAIPVTLERVRSEKRERLILAPAAAVFAIGVGIQLSVGLFGG
jgi:hypothetical protein